MKKTLNISIKLTLIVFLISSIGLISLTYVNVQREMSLFEYSYSEKAEALAQALDASIENRNQLQDKDELLNYILKFIYLNPEIKEISINLPENDKLKVSVSSNSDSIGTLSSYNNNQAYVEGSVIKTSYHDGGSHSLIVITPIHLSGQLVGTYEMVLSMDNAYALMNADMQTLIVISLASLLFLILSFLYLLRRVIIKPISVFRDAVDTIGKGNLDVNIQIETRDEIGELANAFTGMAKDLKEQQENLEKTVVERTKELNKKIDELEKYKKVTVGRELKMIEMKKEMKELKQKSQEGK